MRNELKALEKIFELIPADSHAASRALNKFKADHRYAAGSFVAARAELLQQMIALDLDPYAKVRAGDNKLLTYFTRTKKYNEAAWLMLNKGDRFFYNGNIAEGEKCLNYIAGHFLQKISPEAEYIYLLRTAHLCNAKKEYAQRMFIGMDGYEKMKAQETRNNWWYSNYTCFCIVIADSYFRNDQFEEAWPYLQEALETDSAHTLSTRYRLDIYHNVATYYSIKDDNKSSIEWHLKAIEMLKKENENHPNLIGLYYLISYCYYLVCMQTPSTQKKLRAEILDKMQACLDHCEKIITTLNSPIHIAHLQSSRSRLELLRKNYAGAERLLELSFPVHEKFNHLVGITEYYHIGNKVYYEWGLQTNDRKKLVKAYEYLDKYNQVLNSNAKKTTRTKLNAVRDTYELRQKKLNEQLMQERLDAVNKELQLITLSLHDKILILDELKTFVQWPRQKEPELRQLSRNIVQKIESVKITEQEKNRLQQKLTETSRHLDAVLIKKHPELTNLEISMCNMFKTGITDKELAKLYGQGYKSYEQHRFRIKKKMKLGRGISLVRYLVELGGG